MDTEKLYAKASQRRPKAGLTACHKENIPFVELWVSFVHVLTEGKNIFVV
jgi:hypothetical protein